MATWKLPPQVSTWIHQLSQPLHGRLAWRLLPLLSGLLFAQGRRTVSSWLRAGDLSRDYKPFYRFVGSVGRHVDVIASMLLRLLVRQLPLCALLYIRQKDLSKIAPWNRKHFPFRTKLELAAELVDWVAQWLRFLGKTTWIVADGAYAKRPFVTFKTFLATYPVVGGTIRVVLVHEADSWVAFFCTDPQTTVGQILEAVAHRGAIEQNFHDIKEVHGAGQQQVRHIFANVAAFNVILWLHTLIELWAWDQPASKLRDRSASPWDDPDRRPSHADRRNALRRACIRETFSASLGLAS